ncbi:MAG: PqiC family protein [Aeromonas sp.]
MKKSILTFALLGLLAGCSSSQPTLHYYTLNAQTPPPAAPPVQPQHQLVLTPVTLASQLDRVSLVYQLDGQELYFTEYNRWAGALDDQLNQLTINGLSARLPGWVVRQDNARKGPVLTILVERFQGSHDGRAVLSGRWRLLSEDGTVLRDVPFSQERVLPADGYNALVGELGAGWQQLLEQIASSVRQSGS